MQKLSEEVNIYEIEKLAGFVAFNVPEGKEFVYHTQCGFEIIVRPIEPRPPKGIDVHLKFGLS